MGKREAKDLGTNSLFFFLLNGIWYYGIGWHCRILVLLQIKMVLKLLKSTILYSSSVSGKSFYVTISLLGHY